MTKTPTPLVHELNNNNNIEDVHRNCVQFIATFLTNYKAQE
jgi:hypothetical protein